MRDVVYLLLTMNFLATFWIYHFILLNATAETLLQTIHLPKDEDIQRVWISLSMYMYREEPEACYCLRFSKIRYQPKLSSDHHF